MKIAPSAVFFDLGNVLCAYDWHLSMRNLRERLPGLDTDDFVDWLLSPEGLHDAYCRGEIDDFHLLQDIHHRIDPKGELPDEWILRQWNGIFQPLQDSLALVDELGALGSLHLGLISNTNRQHFHQLDRSLSLRDRFDSITLSFEVGVLKPDASIYRAALQKAHVAPEEAFFTDDLPRHVEGARRVGLRAEVFVSAEELRQALRREGLELSESPRFHLRTRNT